MSTSPSSPENIDEGYIKIIVYMFSVHLTDIIKQLLFTKGNSALSDVYVSFSYVSNNQKAVFLYISICP